MSKESTIDRLRTAGLLEQAEQIAAKHGLALSVLFHDDARRYAHVVRARDEVVAMARDVREWSWPALAELFGFVAHASLMEAYKRHYARCGVVDANVSAPRQFPVRKLMASRQKVVAQPVENLSADDTVPCSQPASSSRALALAPTQSQGLDSSQLSNLTPESHECSALSQTRESTHADSESKETRAIADLLTSLPEFSALNATAVARKIEGHRMGKGSKLEWVLTAISDCGDAVAGLGLNAETLQGRLMAFCKHARAPKQAESGVQRSAKSWRQPEAEAGKGIDYPELRQPGPEEQPAPMTPERIAQLEQLAGTPSQRMVPRRESPPPVEHKRIESETNPEILAKAKADRLELLRRFGEGAGK